MGALRLLALPSSPPSSRLPRRARFGVTKCMHLVVYGEKSLATKVLQPLRHRPGWFARLSWSTPSTILTLFAVVVTYIYPPFVLILGIGGDFLAPKVQFLSFVSAGISGIAQYH
jgi:hypothetical protein